MASKRGVTMDKLINLCKNRGFIFAGSDIYGGLANTWDYGPLGVELKNNIKKAWWSKFVQQSSYNTGIDSSILMNSRVWKASGHLGSFSDPLMDCKNCKSRHRADEIIENYMNKKNISGTPDGWEDNKMEEYIAQNNIPCPVCGNSNFTKIRKFNLMFKTFSGVTEDSANTVYLRPETAQGIFVNFKNILRSGRHKLPFGICQIGKSFRNEITPGNFIFRTREFEQMELEFFCKPGTDMQWFEYWKGYCKDFLIDLGISEENIKLCDHNKEQLSHYSVATTDFQYRFAFGWGELWGIADRTDFDLKAHQNESGQNMEYHDPQTNEKYIPYCIEPSLGVDRILLAFLTEAYSEEVLEGGEMRTLLKLSPVLAPYKAAVLPLQKKLTDKAREFYSNLSKKFAVTYDDSGSIGRRYRRQDEIGTPFCITIDFDTLQDQTVTLRERDSMKQTRMTISEVINFLTDKVEF